MSIPTAPFSFGAVTDKDGLILNQGSFYGFEVGGAMINSLASLSNPTFAQLPNAVIPVNAASYTLPAYAPLRLINRGRYTDASRLPCFFFVIKNISGASTTINAGQDWSMASFSIDDGDSSLIVVSDLGSSCVAYQAGLSSMAGPLFTLNTAAPLAGGAVVNYGDTVNLSFSASQRTIAAGGTGSLTITGGTTGFYATSATAATIDLTNTGVVAASYGGVVAIPVLTINAQGRITAASTVTPSSITMSYTGPLTGSATVALGGTLSITNTALNSIATRNWVAGSSAAVTATYVDSVAVGDTAKCQNQSVVVGSQAGNTANYDSVTLGYSAYKSGGGASVVIGSRALQNATGTNDLVVALGYRAGVTLLNTTGNILIGPNAGEYITKGNYNTACGYGCGPTAGAPTVSNTICIGRDCHADAANAGAIGNAVTNTTANSMLIGDSTAYALRSAGFLQSAAWYSCKAGRSSGTQTVSFPGLVTLTINNTVWTSGCAVSGNNITMPQANTQFSVNACTLINAIVGAAIGTIVMRIRYYDGTTTTTLAQCTLTTIGSTPAGASWCCSGSLQTPNVTTAYVYCELERLSGATTSVDITQWALTVKRDA